MSRDYKPRPKDRYAGQRKSKSERPSGVGLWRWMLITAIIIAFVVFLVYLRSGTPKPVSAQPASTTPLAKTGEQAKAEQKAAEDAAPKPPRFDFYTVLAKKEVVVAEHEIKTRTREERVGKAKETRYIMQAGSFQTFKEAEQLRKKLAALGMESKVQKAKVGKTNWYRVKMGPFTQTGSVNANRARLRQQGIDVIITETNE
ncbi:MAG: SPOR domain-containing protein [Methylococcales bacterium]|nr:SPOR domain-containing protein [Methylococcales bacterium]